MSSQSSHSATRPRLRVAVIIIGVAAISSILYSEDHAAIGAWLGNIDLQQPLDRRNSGLSDFNDDTFVSLHPQNLSTRRRLLPRRPDDEETQEKQMKSYLGGLYPAVDKDTMPVYLRDTLDTGGGVALDPSGKTAEKNSDLIFFWHIPKASYLLIMCSTISQKIYQYQLLSYPTTVSLSLPQASGSTMKNILNFCFDLKRAENIRQPPVRSYL